MQNKNETMFSALIGAAADGILVIDSTGIIQQSNSAASQIFGYTAEELIGHNVKMLMPRSVSDTHDGYLQHHIKTGETSIIGEGRELKGVHRDGREFPFYLSVGRVDYDGVISFVGILRDLTKQKEGELELYEAEQENRQLVNRIAHVSRVSTMGEMAAGIAHEINQPLTAISSYSQTCSRLMSGEEPDLAKIDQTLQKISQQALRAGDIVKNMRQWVKQHDIKPEDQSCNELISGIADIAQLDASEHDVTLIFDLASGLPNVVADTVQVQQVVLNLIRNAIESMIDMPEIDRQKGVCVATEVVDNSRIKVIVSDHGAGIDEGIKDKLFMPFVSTKANGSGLGLSICKSILRLHGGDLIVEPAAEGNGARFSFTLPTSVEGLS